MEILLNLNMWFLYGTMFLVFLDARFQSWLKFYLGSLYWYLVVTLFDETKGYFRLNSRTKGVFGITLGWK